jgi:serine/threonine protein kinase
MLDRDFGTYRLIRRLGRGGVADVYLARNTATGAEVALKLVEQKPDRESREICEAERRGAVLQQQFSLVDDHVPQVHGC